MSCHIYPRWLAEMLGQLSILDDTSTCPEQISQHNLLTQND